MENLIEKNEWYYKYLDITSENTTEPIFHLHHIIPRAYYRHLKIPVDNSQNNLVRLTPEQHVLAHYYLARCSSVGWFKKANYSSVLYMCKKKKSELTEEVVKESAKNFGCLNRGKNNPMFGKTGINNPGSKKVFQYDLSGNFIKAWDSISEASRFFNKSDSTIRSVCYNKSKSAAGYMWSYNKETKNPIRKDYVCRKVYQYDLDGKYISEYSSIKEAAIKTNTHETAITTCCEGKRKMANFFLWSYEKSDIIKYNRGISSVLPIYQYDKDKRLIKKFRSLSEASNILGVSKQYIKLFCLKGKGKKLRDFIFTTEELK